MNDVTITIESLVKLGTFVIAIDELDAIVWISPRLEYHLGPECIGRNLGEISEECDRQMISLALRIEGKGLLPIIGEWIPVNGGGQRIFVGSPAPDTTEEMIQLELELDDYLENDSWLNFLIKSDEASATQRDAIDRIESLKDQQRLIIANRDDLADARRASLNMMLDLEQAMIEAESASKTKSDFLANMSHEIRTPMTAILGFAETLSDNMKCPENLSAIETIQRNGDHLLSIINDILDISKIEANKMMVESIRINPCELVEQVASLVMIQAKAKGLAFKIEYIGKIPETIQTDPTRLRQILINLVGNAIKFTEEGGVRLIIRCVDDKGSSFIQFDVLDTGIGMSENQIVNLFMPFAQADSTTTRKFGGTGLGLTISKRFAELLGGDITIENSKMGVGTRFRTKISTGSLIGINMLSDPQSFIIKKQSQVKIHDTNLKGYRILFAEDGPDNQKLISFVLKKAGAQIVVKENGKLAFDCALAAQSEGKPFDCILMDMQMPVMSGYDATINLRNAGYTGPIIALTAHAMAGDREKCIDAGCDDFTNKPINRSQLIQIIAKYCKIQSRAA